MGFLEFCSSVSIHDIGNFESVLSMSVCVHGGSSLPLRLDIRLSSTLFGFGLARLGAYMSVLKWVTVCLDSAMSLKKYAAFEIFALLLRLLFAGELDFNPM